MRPGASRAAPTTPMDIKEYSVKHEELLMLIVKTNDQGRQLVDQLKDLHLLQLNTLELLKRTGELTVKVGELDHKLTVHCFAGQDNS